MFDLHGRVAVVTGASAGLGSQFAMALARQGADLVLLSRRQGKQDDVADRIRTETGANVLSMRCDVTSGDDVKNAVCRTLETYGKVDILVNNAGRGFQSPLEDYPDDGWSKVVAVDMDGVMRCTRDFGREMLKNHYGRIINISSVMGVGGLQEIHVAAYHACKGAVVNFTRAAAAEWAQTGITVNCILPGFFESESNSPERMEKMNSWIVAHTPMKRAGNPGELDSTVCFLAADESSYVTGAIVPCDGGWTSI